MRSCSFWISHVARRRFSSTDSVGNTPFPPGISEMPLRAVTSAGTLVMSSPLKVTVPAVGRTRPQMPLSKVDLPAPLVPSSATISPSRTSKSTPKRICTWPYAMSTLRHDNREPSPSAAADVRSIVSSLVRRRARVAGLTATPSRDRARCRRCHRRRAQR